MQDAHWTAAVTAAALDAAVAPFVCYAPDATSAKLGGAIEARLEPFPRFPIFQAAFAAWRGWSCDEFAPGAAPAAHVTPATVVLCAREGDTAAAFADGSAEGAPVRLAGPLHLDLRSEGAQAALAKALEGVDARCAALVPCLLYTSPSPRD